MSELTKHCGSCTHFERENIEAEFHRPMVSGEDGRWGYCAIARSDLGERMIKTSTAWASDSESYKAYLCVREDFGCNQWT